MTTKNVLRIAALCSIGASLLALLNATFVSAALFVVTGVSLALWDWLQSLNPPRQVGEGVTRQAQPKKSLFIARCQHSPKGVAVGFGNTAIEAAEALVNCFPFLAGKEIGVAEVAPGVAVGSLEDLKGATIVVECKNPPPNPHLS